MGNCYIFNPAGGVLQVTLNGVDLGPVGKAVASKNYAPQYLITPTSRHDDGTGVLAIADQNCLSIFYPDDPQMQFGPYAVNLCFAGRNVSVDDDVLIFAGRSLQNTLATVVAMTTRGFVLDTACAPAAVAVPEAIAVWAAGEGAA